MAATSNGVSAKDALISRVRSRALTIPTDSPEADGTFEWQSTSMILVELTVGSVSGIGYTYTDACVVDLIGRTLGPLVLEQNLFDIDGIVARLRRHVRNLGRSGLAATAISAIDCALWDAKAKWLGLPLATLLGMRRQEVPIYGSGGFTSYSDEQLESQLGAWVHDDGCQWVKMKIGTHPDDDMRRIDVARKAIGGKTKLFVDANGALTVKSALAMAHDMKEYGVSWFEEPVSSDDLTGLATIRANASAGIDIAAGEYAYVPDDFMGLLRANAVDVLQADVSRCGGISGLLQAAALSDAFHIDLSAHCAPALHCHAVCAVANFRHLEWFHDHVRIESMIFDGVPVAKNGMIRPDLTRLGCGLEIRESDLKPFLISEQISYGKQ